MATITSWTFGDQKQSRHPPGSRHPRRKTPRHPALHQASTYDALVFSSGGTRGIGHLGALHELQRSYDTSSSRFFIGTSVGAIAASIACLGLRPKDVFDACVVPFKYQKNLRLQLLTGDFGLDRGESLEAFIASIIPEGLTFRDVYSSRHNVLSIIATDLTTSSMAIFDPIRTPDMTLREALRISCSIPFLFTAVKRDGHVYVDGALTAAFPVSVAVEMYGCSRILGFGFEEYSSTLHTDWKFEEFVSTVVDTVVHSNSKQSYSHRGVTVDVCTIEMAKDVNGLAFDIPEQTKREMYDAGVISMRVFLKKKS